MFLRIILTLIRLLKDLKKPIPSLQRFFFLHQTLLLRVWHQMLLLRLSSFLISISPSLQLQSSRRMQVRRNTMLKRRSMMLQTPSLTAQRSSLMMQRFSLLMLKDSLMNSKIRLKQVATSFSMAQLRLRQNIWQLRQSLH